MNFMKIAQKLNIKTQNKFLAVTTFCAMQSEAKKVFRCKRAIEEFEFVIQPHSCVA
jgi:hypothetical protein